MSSQTSARRSDRGSDSSSVSDRKPQVYFFHIHGLPTQMSWQALKDFLRSAASQISWADMAPPQHWRTGAVGYARVLRKEEAKKLYKFLVTTAIENRRLEVHWWDISTSQPELRRCNCPGPAKTHAPIPETMAMASQTTNPCLPPGGAPAPMNYPPSCYEWAYGPIAGYPTAGAPEQPYPAMFPLHLADFGSCPLNAMPFGMPGFDPTSTCPSQQMMGHAYHASEHAMQFDLPAPPSFAMPEPPPDAVRVFIEGLPHEVPSQQIGDWFATVAPVVAVEYELDSATQFCTRAAVMYATYDEAQQAILRFAGQQILGYPVQLSWDFVHQTRLNTKRRIAVATRSKAVGPLIVDGSHYRRRPTTAV